jgi:hypothetical protein
MTNASDELYIYRALESPTSIRLLHLEPGIENEPLRGELHDADLKIARSDMSSSSEDAAYKYLGLSKSPTEGFSYEAISYVWGEPIFNTSIRTTRGSIPLTDNLANALRRFRLSDQVRFLWADALCINQKDPAERGHQVKLMSQIYCCAESVLVWLGLDSRHVAAKAFKSIWMTVQERPVSPERLEETYPMARIVLKRKWFRRLWVVQEVLLAQRAYFFWGPEVLLFDHLEAFLVFSGYKSHDWLTLKKMGIFKEIWDLLDECRKLQCVDDRDHIYAILGLPYSNRNPLTEKFRSIEPDYKITRDQLFINVACMFVGTHNIGPLLSHVNHRTKLKDTTLPSWIPDWSCWDAHIPVFGRWTDLPHNEEASYLGDGSLRVWGVQIDTVSYAAKRSLDGGHSHRNTEEITNFWNRTGPGQQQPSVTQPAHDEHQLVQALTNGVLEDRKDVDWSDLFVDLLANWEIPRNGTGTIQHLQPDDLSPASAGKYSSVGWSICRTWASKKLFQTSGGLLGLGPAAMRQDDIVIRVSGVLQSVVLRREEGYYSFIGCAWLPGLGYCKATVDELTAFELR